MSCRASRRCRRDHERLLIDRWDIVGLLRDLTARGQHPGIIAFAEDGVVASWDSGTVADKALRLAHGLQDAGVGRQPGRDLGAQLSGLDRGGARRLGRGRGGCADR